jgi:C1A family cysteine protease
MDQKIKTHKIKRYGWIPDLPDHRDHLYATPPVVLRELPPQADLRKMCPPVYDQGELGSCTGNAIAAAIEFERIKQKLPDFVPSRLFIYYNERVIEGTTASDSGAQIRDGIKCIADQGACPESEWPYSIDQFATKPPDQCYQDALKDKALLYSRVSQIGDQMKGCLASGFPFVFGFTVYESFESSAVAQSGNAPMPGPGEQVLGGHAVLAVGYDDAQQRFLVRNSWGTGWGMQGYFTLPYAYLMDSNLSDDLWTVRLISAATPATPSNLTGKVL